MDVELLWNEIADENAFGNALFLLVECPSECHNQAEDLAILDFTELPQDVRVNLDQK